MYKDVEWHADEESYAFKIVYTLKLSELKLILLYDKKINKVVTGTVIIDTDEYMEFDLSEFTIEEAKHQLALKAINIGSSVLIKKSKSDPARYEALLDNLSDIYTMEAENFKRLKEDFRKRYQKGEAL